MLAKKMADALNKQLGYEAYAASSYLAMASWCEQQGLRGCAEFFYEQSAEEREHMLKIFRFINVAGGAAVVPAVKEPPAGYKSINDVFETSLKQEVEVSQQINKMVELSLDLKDYPTNNFLQWFVGEQVEEEALFTTILGILKLAGTSDRSLLLVDNEIAKIRGGEKS